MQQISLRAELIEVLILITKLCNAPPKAVTRYFPALAILGLLLFCTNSGVS